MWEAGNKAVHQRTSALVNTPRSTLEPESKSKSESKSEVERMRAWSLHPASASGFTLLELLVVIAIMALATAGVSLAMRDSAQTALEREAQRLAVLFESARAQSRASGVQVVWRTTDEGFEFDGLAENALPNRWLAGGTRVYGTASVQLGPEPIIGPQAIELRHDSAANQSTESASRPWRITTDGVRPFTAQVAQ